MVAKPFGLSDHIHKLKNVYGPKKKNYIFKLFIMKTNTV